MEKTLIIVMNIIDRFKAGADWITREIDSGEKIQARTHNKNIHISHANNFRWKHE